MLSDPETGRLRGAKKGPLRAENDISDPFDYVANRTYLFGVALLKQGVAF
jgi:hypothetical protein